MHFSCHSLVTRALLAHKKRCEEAELLCHASGIFKADLNLDDLERLPNVQVSSFKKLVFLKRETNKNVFNLLNRVRFLLCIIRSPHAGKEQSRSFPNLSKVRGTGCTFQGTSPPVLWSHALSRRSLQCLQNYITISEKRCKSRGLGRNGRESPGQRRSLVLRQSPFLLRREAEISFKSLAISLYSKCRKANLSEDSGPYSSKCRLNRWRHSRFWSP